MWTRRREAGQREYDIRLSSCARDGRQYKCDPSRRMPAAHALWEHDGVR